MNKYYFYFRVSLLNHLSIPFRGTLIYSVKKKKKKTLQIEISANILDDQKFSLVRVKAVFNDLPQQKEFTENKFMKFFVHFVKV